jgi:hypothetical protein
MRFNQLINFSVVMNEKSFVIINFLWQLAEFNLVKLGCVNSCA